MFKKLKEKILNLSSSYTFYKNEYVRLNSRCEVLEENNRFLKEEVKELLSKEYKLLESSDFSNMDNLVDAFLSNQEYFTKLYNENKHTLESLEDSCMRIEKSSAYTNLKLDSKFDEQKRYIMDEILTKIK